MEVAVDAAILAELAKANKQFRKKDYFQSLESYCECLKLLYRQRQTHHSQVADQLEMVVYSLRGMNYSAIREFEKAENDFDYVLKNKNFDGTTLMRRASLHLKTKQYKKALIDITRLLELEPESIRVAALMLEVKDRLSKMLDKGQRESLEKDLDELNNLNTEEIDEEEMLNFCNLKKIDRKSIQLPKSRASTVAFKEDTQVTYENEQVESLPGNPRKSLREEFSTDKIKHILDTQKDDLIEREDETAKPRVSIVFKLGKQPKKSILKCSSIRVANEDLPITDSKQHILNALSIRDIQGRPIRCSQFSKVKFRNSKTIDPRELPYSEIKLSLNKVARKSCLKHSAFGLGLESKISAPSVINNLNTPRTSRSQSFLKLANADGKLLCRSDGLAHIRQRKGQERNNQESDASFDSGDEHNIFGFEGSMEISDKLKKTLGLEEQDGNKQNNRESQPKTKSAKKSILKKNSGQQQESGISEPSTFKSKKSVLFKP